jgi:hypothetical protein
MAYFIFNKFSDNGNLFKIQETISDLNNTNIMQNEYKIIEDTQENFNSVKYGLKYVTCQNNTLIFEDSILTTFKNKEDLQENIKSLVRQINQFLDWNTSHPLYSRWSTYKNQLNNLNLNSITYPLNKTLEQYFNDLEQPSFNILQLP